MKRSPIRTALLGLAASGASAVALRCGYADHAHMTREFRALGGGTPTALRAGSIPAGSIPTFELAPGVLRPAGVRRRSRMTARRSSADVPAKLAGSNAAGDTNAVRTENSSMIRS